MTCPKCREQDKYVSVEIKSVNHDKRSVEAKISVVCPECGWEGGPYAI